jgi:hypothetical protein
MRLTKFVNQVRLKMVFDEAERLLENDVNEVSEE